MFQRSSDAGFLARGFEHDAQIGEDFVQIGAARLGALPVLCLSSSEAILLKVSTRDPSASKS